MWGKDEGLRERRARETTQALYAMATWGAWMALSSRPTTSQIKGVRVASVLWNSSQNTCKSWHLFSHLPGNSNQCPAVSDVRRQPSCGQQPTDHQLKPVWLPGAINWCPQFPLPGKKEPEGSPGREKRKVLPPIRSELVFSGAADCSHGLHSSRGLPWQLFPQYLPDENSQILSQGL